MNLFLRLKHWQLFFLVLGIPLVLGILDTLIYWTNGESLSGLRIGINLINLIPVWSYYLWVWSVGYEFSRRLERKNKLYYQNTYFPWIVLVSATAMTLILIYFTFVELSPEIDRTQENTGSPMNNFLLVFFLFIGLAGLFTAINYMVKILVSAERQAAVRPNDFFSEYVMAVVFPIGVWLLQPRINRLNQKENDDR